MALDVLAATQGGTCALTTVECCVYVPNYNKNITGLLTDMNNQIGSFKTLHCHLMTGDIPGQEVNCGPC